MDFARAVYEVARKDVLQHIRTKRLLIIGIFFFVMLQLVTVVLPMALGDLDDPEPGQPSIENSLFYFHLNASVFGGLFALQLLVIVLTADAVCSEWSQRTIFLLLSKPVSRTAFVIGKYVGALVSILPMVVAIYVVQYFLMMAIYPGQPTADEAVGFVSMLLMLAIGVAAVSAVALFFSTLTRSNVMALVLSLLSVFLFFPIVSLIGDLTYAFDEEQYYDQEFEGLEPTGQEPDPEDWKYDWSHYATPISAMSVAPKELMPHSGDDDDFSFSLALFIPQFAPHRTWMSVISAVVFTSAFVGASVLRVNKRNFE